TRRRGDGARRKRGDGISVIKSPCFSLAPSPRHLVAPSHLSRLIADQTMSAVVWAKAPAHSPPKPPHKSFLSVALKRVKSSALYLSNSPCHVVRGPLT